MTATEATATGPGWVRRPEGLVWGHDARNRLTTMLHVMALFSPDEQHMIAEPEPPADHEHTATETRPCTCQALWLSGDMPPRDGLPRRPGVYVCYDEQHDPAYIGTSRGNVRARLLAHHRDPAKPVLTSWLGFWPSEFSEPAAIWEIRLIDRERPYLNRQHAERVAPVQWEPKPPAPPRRPWYEADPAWLWFMDGPALLISLEGSAPWQVAKVVGGLFADGITEDEIWDACEITMEKGPLAAAVPYMAAVARNRQAERP